MTSIEEKEEVSSDQPVVEQPPSTDEQTVTSEPNDSAPGKEKGPEKGDEQQNGEDNGQTTSEVKAKEDVEEEPTAKPMDKPSRKLRCVDPTDTVDILMGEAGINASKPVTVSALFERTFKTWPDVKALCWKNKKEEPWQILTYAQYKKLIYDVAKSFLKVMCCMLVS